MKQEEEEEKEKKKKKKKKKKKEEEEEEDEEEEEKEKEKEEINNNDNKFPLLTTTDTGLPDMLVRHESVTVTVLEMVEFAEVTGKKSAVFSKQFRFKKKKIVSTMYRVV